ncbi:hypothetical protein Pint_16331 [Pistacia integerrima]|uniref:Uncharacterized protein n=2 Tax=Pistacia integerrima TaxID=434235 RepID=A0ACC0ZC32_9ROSI|nr:hypothetical protein Pint_16328 [Pistacia integerrima]KAJ0049126.1 hypothetical protein Pint_16331 [Pistacia integerrima]
MDILNLFKAFFLSVLTKIYQLLPRATPLIPPVLPAPPIAFDHEAIEAEPVYNPRPAAPVANRYNLDWAMIMIGFSLPSAVEIALQSLQIRSQFPPMFHFLCLAIVFSFTFLFVSKFMSSTFPVIAQTLERFGVLSAVTAIFVAITIPLPLWLKCVTWALYAISFLVVIFCILYRV